MHKSIQQTLVIMSIDWQADQQYNIPIKNKAQRHTERGSEMRNIINNAIKLLNKKSTLDEIKAVLSAECKKATFTITNEDWNYMFDEVLLGLSGKENFITPIN